MTLFQSCITYHIVWLSEEPMCMPQKRDVFAWRALFEAALRSLESFSSGLAGGEKKEGEEPNGVV